MAAASLVLPTEVLIEPNEFWWGGLTADGVAMPFSAGTTAGAELTSDLRGNQGVPLLISSLGRYLWSDAAFDFRVDRGVINISGAGTISLSEGHENLAGAFRAAAHAHFPASGQVPPREFFAEPQYNTWIELNHYQTQAGVLLYAENLIKEGYPPGILMIDAGWAEDFGHFEFHTGRFPDPAAMMRRLKELGFRVMLWVSPFISADSVEFRRIRYKEGWLLQDESGKPAILEWWDGYSAHVDLTHPEALAWFHGKLAGLQREYGIDGFKFDAGDTLHYKTQPRSHGGASPAELTEAWVRLGLTYPFNEYRASWKCGSEPVVQRLADKSPLWDNTGLASLIPNGIALSLLGHPFLCPDMIGGGDYVYFNSANYSVDDELFVRSAQVSALFPMMQFSCAPWRVLSAEANALCLAAVRIHQRFADVILAEAERSARTGEPILRPMEYEFPKQGYATVKDQFFLGSSVLVSPALGKGQAVRRVAIPPGTWTDDRGTTVNGPVELEVETPIDRLPFWTRADF